MDRCPLLTDADIYHAVACLPNLEALSMQGSPTAGDPYKRLHEQVQVCCPPHSMLLPCCLPQALVQLMKSITMRCCAMLCVPNGRILAMQGLACHPQGLTKSVQVHCLQCRAPAFHSPFRIFLSAYHLLHGRLCDVPFLLACRCLAACRHTPMSAVNKNKSSAGSGVCAACNGAVQQSQQSGLALSAQRDPGGFAGPEQPHRPAGQHSAPSYAQHWLTARALRPLADSQRLLISPEAAPQS